MASKPLHFVSLTYSFIMLDAKLLKPLHVNQNSFTGPLIIRTFEKRALGLKIIILLLKGHMSY